MHNSKLTPKPHPYRILFGQMPLTKFKDYRKSIKVDLLYCPEKKEIMSSVYDFVKATWSEDGRESERATKEQMSEALITMLEGKALGLGIETIDFIFRIGGITRIDTHQIVRQRIGVTFSQQCTGDRFLTHNDVLIEENMNQPEILENLIKATITCKMSYAEMCDSLKISIQGAREILPHNLETFVFMKVNLMTLVDFYRKRIDDGSQTWPINIIAQQMSDAVCEKYPELKMIFDKAKTSYKFQTEASKDRKNISSTSLYIPKNDTDFDYHERDFLYQIKKEEMNFTNTPIEDMYFWGFNRITKQQYEIIQSLYENLNGIIDEQHLTNAQILSRANCINQAIEEDLFTKM
jgi:thymidylate synthase (FAD)